MSPPLAPDVRRRRVLVLAVVTALLLAFCAAFAYFGRPPLVIEGAKNTGDMLFRDGVSSYTLGSPRWERGTVTYPITYELARTQQACQGSITLVWNWSQAGWVLGGGEEHCSPQVFP